MSRNLPEDLVSAVELLGGIFRYLLCGDHFWGWGELREGVKTPIVGEVPQSGHVPLLKMAITVKTRGVQNTKKFDS